MELSELGPTLPESQKVVSELEEEEAKGSGSHPSGQKAVPLPMLSQQPREGSAWGPEVPTAGTYSG